MNNYKISIENDNFFLIKKIDQKILISRDFSRFNLEKHFKIFNILIKGKTKLFNKNSPYKFR
jgi:hypothetical protein